MTFFILTLFPEMFETITASSILKRAREKKIIKIKLVNIRDFTKDKHKIVDDKPYGGGKGMILKVDVLVNALETIKPKPYTVLLSPSGEKYDDEVISIGDFILTGGEIAAMAVVDSVARLIPDVIHPESLKKDCFLLGSPREAWGDLEYPQYTRPANFRGLKIPKILLSGNHQQISDWRRKQAAKRTRKYRPDLIKIDKNK